MSLHIQYLVTSVRLIVKQQTVFTSEAKSISLFLGGYMEKFDLYSDISRRTNGDIYMGVVGPVRCGKSTFITKFMQTLVLPNIKDKFDHDRAVDELPQSADGKTIMTTQPRFVPNEAVQIDVGGTTQLSVRMIDCVGYLVSGALGHVEGEKPRLVKTPWSEEEMPFEEAAELGTKKVVDEHSTIAIAMTTDGSIGELERSAYVESEEKVMAELASVGKPHILIVNTTKPKDDSTKKLVASLEKKYGVCVLAMNVLEMQEGDIDKIFEKILLEFPIKAIEVDMPEWMTALDYEDDIIKEVVDEVTRFGEGATKIGQIDKAEACFVTSENFEPTALSKIKMGEGKVVISVTPKPELFYKVLSRACGENISDDFHLISYVKTLAHAKQEYDKIRQALNDAEVNGYGIVTPQPEEMSLEDPKIVRQGSKFGVKLKASAPSLHIMKVDIETEINPLVGTEQQSEELVKYLMSEFENNPQSIWETNMFGRSLHMLVNEGINTKVNAMPVEAQRKIRKTLAKIVNEGKGGIICILL